MCCLRNETISTGWKKRTELSRNGMRAELDELKGVVGVAFTAIVALVAAMLVMWSF